MSKREQNTSAPEAASRLDRRTFLSSSAALGAAGMGAVFTTLGREVVAQNAPTPPVGGPPPGQRPPPPPEPTVSQAAPIKDLKGKTAYITAASDGIGLGIARAASNAGMKVVIGYRNEERLKAALPLFRAGNAGVHAIKHDVTDRDGWTKLVEEINGKFGNLHLVVNNAGVKTLRQAHQASYEEWDNAVAVNFTAIYNSVAACLPHMLKHGEGGHFVTTASMGGLLPGVNAGVYTSTKIAAVAIMEALRVELESTSVGTSVFCPGLVSTDNYPMGEENPYRKAQAEKAGRQPPPQMPAVGMDPLEAGDRVLNGVLNNDLFILSHPEFKAGMQERFDAIMASTPSVEVPIPQARIDSEARVIRCGIYARETAHRKQKRKSYRAV